jgi:hypothetical protein
VTISFRCILHSVFIFTVVVVYCFIMCMCVSFVMCGCFDNIFTVLWLRYFLTWLTIFLPWLRFFRDFVIFPALFYISCYLCCSVVIFFMYRLCVNVCCHRVTTQLQLTNISYHHWRRRSTNDQYVSWKIHRPHYRVRWYALAANDIFSRHLVRILCHDEQPSTWIIFS